MSSTVTYAPGKGKRTKRNRSNEAEKKSTARAGKAKTPKSPKAKGVKAYSKMTDAALAKRNDLIIEYLPLVKFIANRIAGRLPSHIEVADLINSGIIGLIDALTKFDATLKIKFKTYAEFRIKGAILDELRALDWVPRSTRQKATRLEKAYAEVEQKLGRSASDAEMIEFLGIAREDFESLIREAKGVALISIDELRPDSDDSYEHNLLEFLADPDQLTPAQLMNLDQIYRIVADTIDQLPEKERLVISLYYYEELTMKEIGEIMSITESRVSQIHTKAILRLRGRLLKLLES